jgi:hypothetical protein
VDVDIMLLERLPADRDRDRDARRAPVSGINCQDSLAACDTTSYTGEDWRTLLVTDRDSNMCVSA